MLTGREVIHIIAGFLTFAGFWVSVALLICTLVGWLAWLPFWISLTVFIMAGIVVLGNFVAMIRDSGDLLGLRRLNE